MVSLFISYAHEADESWKPRMLQLANRLRADGVESRIDQYIQHPPDGWVKWMERQVTETDYRLVISSPLYWARCNQIGGGGSGARFEGAIITSMLFQANSLFETCGVGILAPHTHLNLPPLWAGCPRYDIGTEGGYTELFRWVTKQPAIDAPPVLPLRILPANTVLKFTNGYQLLCQKLIPLLDENRRIFKDFAPNSGANGSGELRFDLMAWNSLKRARIVPNNNKARELIREHWQAISEVDRPMFEKLLTHFDAFEAHVINGPIDYKGKTFPAEVDELIRAVASEPR